MYLKSEFLMNYHQNLSLATEWTKRRSHFVLKSVNFSQFMMSEGTEMLILVFTKKAGQSEAHNRHRIFLFGFFCHIEDIFRHFLGLISDSRVQAYSR